MLFFEHLIFLIPVFALFYGVFRIWRWALRGLFTRSNH